MPQTPVIKDWLDSASHKLSAKGIPSANLDAEIILTNTLQENRTYLHAHPEKIIDIHELEIANSRLDQRLNRVPIAYIIGYREFYGREFIVTPATLIPRPESEAIIDVLKTILVPNSNNKTQITRLVDVGTGSGCLGITAKLELPNLDVTLADISVDALQIAKQNAQKFSTDVTILESDLLQEYTLTPDIIIANLPYVDQDWECSPETSYEPALALFADNNGRSIIEKLIPQSSELLKPGGYLIIEADPIQHNSLKNYAKRKLLNLIYQLGYIIVFKYEII
jgi:release factor glutamine methyltransferase